MTPLLVAISLAAAPVEHSVLVLDFTATNADEDTTRLVGDIVAAEVAKRVELKVDTGEDIRRRIDVETEKIACGASGEDCLVELAGALGADYIVFGSIGTLGSTTIINVSFFDAARSQSAARVTIEADSPSAIPGAIKAKIPPVLDELLGTSSAVFPWVGGGVLAIGATGAAVFGIGALVLDLQLGATGTSRANKLETREVGLWLLAGSAVSTVVAGSGALLILFGGE